MKTCLLVLFALFYVAVGDDVQTKVVTTPGITTVPSTAAQVTTVPSTTAQVTTGPSTAPQVTTAPPTTTQVTTAPPTTTQVTTAPPTTTQATTTPGPSPGSETTNTYKYAAKNNTVCLLAKFSSHFSNNDETWNVSSDAEVINATSNCGKLSVEFGESKFAVIFKQTSKNAFYIAEVTALLNLDSKPKTFLSVKAENLTLAKTSNASSYMCLSGIYIEMSDNVTFHMTNVQVQAYYVKDGKFATALTCTGDFPKNMLVPIAVGCALGGLIAVVLIAYCILRSRATRKYNPVDNTI